MKIVLVDDEPEILTLVRDYLTREGYSVVTAANGLEGMEIIEGEKPDLVLLDWMLPGLNGLEMCKRLRETSTIPIIMLTAKSEEIDRVLGLEFGADDYIVKPFSLRELAARVKTVLRRSGGGAQETASSVIARGEISLDISSHKVLKRGQEIFLTPTEFNILHLLALRPGTVYSRLQLLRQAMGEEYLYYERSIDTHVSNLRKKIEDNPSEPKYIETVFGVGYRFGEGL
ncbi:response regulator with CheY-like receiver domain and winged-helix DNA-binding domain [Desulfosporosinus orientis DSM 765]|uniref:Stage 0 sporulation protein A homolog n=1 Tax=Desulfosporosinus orientis (strain ATCC 19365 / DSM 765 / NCIMB 8382 / VKM B-1628 / Singapore I) TaxID=768706 RepID=G7W9V1_DESOD|nr:response regulator transcription factor [Desulfosporosinus orientis]AET70667.1 response regulator with CheY-like receiver domain and winged-helix DNA-binding domain [Desulfosporosinus orientis DSM 765]